MGKIDGDNFAAWMIPSPYEEISSALSKMARIANAVHTLSEWTSRGGNPKPHTRISTYREMQEAHTRE